MEHQYYVITDEEIRTTELFTHQKKLFEKVIDYHERMSLLVVSIEPSLKVIMFEIYCFHVAFFVFVVILAQIIHIVLQCIVQECCVILSLSITVL